MNPKNITLYKKYDCAWVKPTVYIPAHEVGAIIKAIMSEKDLDTRLNWLAKADELEKMK